MSRELPSAVVGSSAHDRGHASAAPAGARSPGVCFVSCHFPPLSRTARRYGFARLLADGGCRVEVVAHGNVSRALGAFVDDAGMAADDAEIPVHRPHGLPWHLAGEVLYRIGVLPCPHLNWMPAAVRAAARVAAGPQDVVLGVYPPLTDLLVAAAVSRRTGARLVLDFRDEYRGLHSGLRSGWARVLEPRLVQRAALVSAATEAVLEGLAARYRLPAERRQLTHNGYWEEVAQDVSLPARPGFRLVYAGALSGAQGLEVLAAAVERLGRERPDLRAACEVVVYGPDNAYLRRRLGGRLAAAGVRYGGFLPAAQVSGALLDADACFLSLASERFAYAVPGKLYEGIAHARPLLACLPAGGARRLIEEEGFGLVAPCGDAAELASRLAEMMEPSRRLQFHARLLARRGCYAARPQFLALARRIQGLP
ncbi:MAG: glycosyltransferase [Candidatus Latescibacterota bacterium]